MKSSSDWHFASRAGSTVGDGETVGLGAAVGLADGEVPSDCGPPEDEHAVRIAATDATPSTNT